MTIGTLFGQTVRRYIHVFRVFFLSSSALILELLSIYNLKMSLHCLACIYCFLLCTHSDVFLKARTVDFVIIFGYWGTAWFGFWVTCLVSTQFAGISLANVMYTCEYFRTTWGHTVTICCLSRSLFWAVACPTQIKHMDVIEDEIPKVEQCFFRNPSDYFWHWPRNPFLDDLLD